MSAPSTGCGASGYIHAYWEVLECQASAGDQRAAFQLAQMFDRGEGAPQDLKRAARYYTIAATPSAGTVPIYVPPVRNEHFGHTTNVRLGERTAGIPEAQLALAQMYADGRGVTRNTREARRWAQRALNGGAPGAADLLARLEALGR
jgi:TPR repeat protein